MKDILARVIGLGLIVGSIFVVRVAIPRAYPAIFKVTGMAVVTKAQVEKLAAVYALTGAVGGAGLVLLFFGTGRK